MNLQQVVTQTNRRDNMHKQLYIDNQDKTFTKVESRPDHSIMIYEDDGLIVYKILQSEPFTYEARNGSIVTIFGD